MAGAIAASTSRKRSKPGKIYRYVTDIRRSRLRSSVAASYCLLYDAAHQDSYT